ncbi:exported hypothetical protein [Pseudomonas lundensis]|uniref:Uncharacterized protein n=1 Tax=Pseudomonas lundensis TaxID=86185 RepID=A0AAX2HBW3_9PSED|nr:exported hypothetical protein [Pseudomonas lundensis]
MRVEFSLFVSVLLVSLVFNARADQCGIILSELKQTSELTPNQQNRL